MEVLGFWNSLVLLANISEDKGKVKIPETGEEYGLEDSNFKLTCSKAHFDQQKSALENAVKVTKTENEEKRILLDDANTEAKNLKTDFDHNKNPISMKKNPLWWRRLRSLTRKTR